MKGKENMPRLDNCFVSPSTMFLVLDYCHMTDKIHGVEIDTCLVPKGWWETCLFFEDGKTDVVRHKDMREAVEYHLKMLRS